MISTVVPSESEHRACDDRVDVGVAEAVADRDHALDVPDPAHDLVAGLAGLGRPASVTMPSITVT